MLLEGDALSYRVAVHGARLMPGSIALHDAIGPISAPGPASHDGSGGRGRGAVAAAWGVRRAWEC